MASIRRHAKGWRAEVQRQGQRRSKVFATRREAQEWAARQEYLILHGDKVAAAAPLSDLLTRYAREVSPTKRGERWEAVRLAKLARDPLGAMHLGDVEPRHIADWRDRRLREVSAGSVRREMILLSAVLTVARKEWGLISKSPMDDVRKPASPPPRQRLPTDDEIERLRHVAGSELKHATARAFHAFLFSGETAMRAGEIVGLTWDRIDLDARAWALTKMSRKVDALTLARISGHRDLSLLLRVYYRESAADVARRLD